MEYAIHYPNSTMVARDARGNFHIYPDRATAERVAAGLGEGYTVKPYGSEEE